MLRTMACVSVYTPYMLIPVWQGLLRIARQFKDPLQDHACCRAAKHAVACSAHQRNMTQCICCWGLLGAAGSCACLQCEALGLQ